MKVSFPLNIRGEQEECSRGVLQRQGVWRAVPCGARRGRRREGCWTCGTGPLRGSSVKVTIAASTSLIINLLEY